jgi:hypothetical protein
MKVLGLVVSSCVLLAASLPSALPADGFVPRNYIPPGPGHTALRRAIVGARLRLERPECRRLFAEFADANGRPLQQNLDALGQTGVGYLGLIVFADASDSKRCMAGGVFAFTTPGSRVVYVCGAHLKEAADQNAARAEAVVIHEALHSLGLGENPPSSEEITARVLARCYS